MNEKNYEIIFIVSGNLSEAEAEKAALNVKNLITQTGGKIFKESSLGRKKFAYPLSHQKHGFYYVYQFTLEASELSKISQELRLNKTEILRFLFTQEQPYQTEVLPVQRIPQIKKIEKPKVAKTKISLEDLDKKLDELLDKEIVQ